jgi:uncharacterized protein with PIN domain
LIIRLGNERLLFTRKRKIFSEKETGMGKVVARRSANGHLLEIIRIKKQTKLTPANEAYLL